MLSETYLEKLHSSDILILQVPEPSHCRHSLLSVLEYAKLRKVKGGGKESQAHMPRKPRTYWIHTSFHFCSKWLGWTGDSTWDRDKQLFLGYNGTSCVIIRTGFISPPGYCHTPGLTTWWGGDSLRREQKVIWKSSLQMIYIHITYIFIFPTGFWSVRAL